MSDEDAIFYHASGLLNFVRLIEEKRDGRELTPETFQYIIQAYTRQKIPDYQMAAFLMAIYFQGLSPEETCALTLSMRDSGPTLAFPADPRPLVDKHSTGGVGDKISLVLVPLLASLGFRVPMISGRGLGITGGTLDKLDSIPGFRSQLSHHEIISQVQEIGAVICGQTPEMVPADAALYALRDVTGTVPSIPLICASILSKKLAENISALVLDVKFGGAAFMGQLEEARKLAKLMVSIATRCGLHTRALLTPMESPLGCSAGNWVEVREADACLQGKGVSDLETMAVECAAHLLVMTGRERNLESARTSALTPLHNGSAQIRWEDLLVRQGANLELYRSKIQKQKTGPCFREVHSRQAGYVRRCDARLIGEALRDLGAGRATKNSPIDLEAGIDQIRKIGEPVEIGDILARVHASSEGKMEEACREVHLAFEIGDEKLEGPPLITEIIDA